MGARRVECVHGPTFPIYSKCDSEVKEEPQGGLKDALFGPRCHMLRANCAGCSTVCLLHAGASMLQNLLPAAVFLQLPK